VQVTEPEASAVSDQPKHPSLRHVPTWAWVLGALFYPEGIFICLGVARAIRWWAAALLTLASLGYVLLFAKCVSTPTPNAEGSFISLGYVFYMGCVGLLQYVIGQRRGLWTRGGRWVWQLGGYFLMALAALGTLNALLHLVMRDLNIE